MKDLTNHNRLAEQFAERLRDSTAATVDQDYVAARMVDIAGFEARAGGEKPRKARRASAPKTTTTKPTQPHTAATAAEVATPRSEPTMSNVHNLFAPATPTTAYLKAGFMGKQGAGKSVTGGLLAIGLVKYLQHLGVDYAAKPVAFFDTELGSDWLIPTFEEVGIPLVVAKKRAFADLVEAVKWAEANASVLIIDSITHPWRELQESYLKTKKRSFLQIDDWSYLKGPHGWQQFTDLYINSKLHIIMCGRAGDDTEQYTDENGKRQFEKVGVKMKTETETGFEPSLLVLMERDMDLRTKKPAHTATIVKDRSMLLDGKDFTFQGYDEDGNGLPTEALVRQTWAAFAPHIKRLNIGGQHVGVQAQGDSTHLIKTEKRDWQPVQRKIVLGEIQDLLVEHVGGQAAADKKRRIELLRACFDAGWVEIEETMALPDLRAGYDLLHQELTGKPSKYSSALKVDATPANLNDSLPEFAAAAG
jgi:hypothetical protein